MVLLGPQKLLFKKLKLNSILQEVIVKTSPYKRLQIGYESPKIA